ncbi:MAG: nucleotide sugar epimerase [Candidatus Altiarchaeales archaeon WOR_SM1_86-2]|nr:MAG: nucleotide sugar epimerase [Candidatus Altiarchaeales archaeon WOR_SM1_86-2]
MNFENILVTGSAGFIGAGVAKKLLDKGVEVVGIDNMNDYYNPELKEWRLKRIEKYANFKFFRADIGDRDSLEEIFDEHEFDAIINLAARAGVRASIEDPWLYLQTNVTGTLNLLELAREKNIKKIVHASSSSVYGNAEIPFSEDENTDRPVSQYAATKKSSEVLCYTYHYLYGLNITILRYFTVYGPAGRPDMALLKFIRSVSEGEEITVFGDGTQKRDFTYIDDIAEGTIKALKPLGYEIINLGNDRPIEVAHLIKLIEDNLGKKAKIKRLERHPADVKDTWANIEKAKKLLGWEPKTSIEESVKRTAEWYKKVKNLRLF